MRYFSYNTWKTDPSVDSYVETMSEEEIYHKFYQTWYDKMCKKFGKELVDKTYSFEECLDDWKIVNRAWEANDE